jgi:hypothetical protein
MTEWKVRGLHRAKHVRVYLWRDEEGDQEDADAIVEVRPSIHAELPASDQALVRLSLFRFDGHAWCGGQAVRTVSYSAGRQHTAPLHGHSSSCGACWLF